MQNTIDVWNDYNCGTTTFSPKLQRNEERYLFIIDELILLPKVSSLVLGLVFTLQKDGHLPLA